MKRSEMISKLIQYHEEVFLNIGRGMTQKEYYAGLLEMLEDEGMLPPNRKATPEDFANWGLTQEFLNDHEFEVNGWEDEQKD